MEWQKPVTTDRSEVLSWLAGVEAGTIGRRKGGSKPYSRTTLVDYARAYRNFLRPRVRRDAD